MERGGADVNRTFVPERFQWYACDEGQARTLLQGWSSLARRGTVGRYFSRVP